MLASVVFDRRGAAPRRTDSTRARETGIHPHEARREHARVFDAIIVSTTNQTGASMNERFQARDGLDPDLPSECA